ncbi:MAG: bacitracin transporter ATP-binding protein [Bacilli bacterium]|nr:bacitracin transporter ATP-binding protein [Bacilli bacterium]
MSEMIIQTYGLTRRYGKQTSVNNLNMNVPRGSIYGFLGPNGAGKTTTIRMILGLIRPSSGEVRVFNQPFPSHRISILKRVGSLVESPSYYGHLTGYENLDVLAKLLGASPKRIHEMLNVVRLTSAANKKVKGYSLGMKQRLGIAAALLGQPDLLILDEPTNGLDPSGIHEIRELIKEMPKQHGITVLVSSHLLSEIEQMANQVGIINEGNLIFEDHIEVLRKRSLPKLILEVDRPQEALSIVQRIDRSAVIENGVLELSHLDYAQTAELNRQLVQEGHSVYRIREWTSSLESIFLDLVGKGTSL